MNSFDTLTAADFQPINDLFQGVSIYLPDIVQTTQIPVVNQDITFTLSNLVCRNLSLATLEVTTEGDAGFTPLPVDDGSTGPRSSPPPPPPPPVPSPPPPPQPCVAAAACNFGCGETPEQYKDDANLPDAQPDQCYWCEDYSFGVGMPDYCEYEYDGWTVDYCCVRHQCTGACVAGGRRLDDYDAAAAAASRAVQPTRTRAQLAADAMLRELRQLGELSEHTVEIGQQLSGVAVECDASWQSSYDVFLIGTVVDYGTIGISTTDASLTSRMEFTSPDWAISGPTNYTLLECTSNVPLTVPRFTWETNTVGGSLLSVDNLRQMIVELVQSDVDQAICDSALGTALGDALGTGLPAVSAMITPYLNESYVFANPAEAEARVTAAAAADGVNLIDLANPTAALPSLAQFASDSDGGTDGDDPFGRLLSCLGGVTWEDGGAEDGGMAEQINGAARSALANGTFACAMTLPLFDVNSSIADLALNLTGVSLGGLDTFRSFEVARVAFPTTLSHLVAMGALDVAANFSMRLSPPTGTEGGSNVSLQGDFAYEDDFSVALGARDILLNASTLLGIDADELQRLTLGALLQAPLGCAGLLLHAAEVSRLQLAVSQFTDPALGGFVSDGVSHIASVLVDALFAMFQQVVLRALPVAADSDARLAINAQVPQLKADLMAPETCVPPAAPPPGPATDASYLDLRLRPWWIEPVWDGFEYVTGNDPATGLSRIACGVPPELALASPVAASISEPFADITIAVTQASAVGLDSLHNVTLAPAGPHNLSAGAALAPPWRPLEARVAAAFSIDAANTPPISNSFVARAAVEDLRLSAAAFAYVDAYRAGSMTVASVVSVDCWLATLRAERGAYLSRLALDVGAISLELDCVNCTSPGLVAIANATQDPATRALLEAAIADGVEALAAAVTGDDAAGAIDVAVAEATVRCEYALANPGGNGTGLPGDSAPLAVDGDGSLAAKTATIVAFGLLFACCGAAACARCCGRQRSARRAQVAALPDAQRRAVEAEPSLYRDEAIPLWVRRVVPATLCVNVLFFFMGHIMQGASVDVVLSLLGEGVAIPGVFGFSIAASTADMWAAGAVELALILILFSGVWPYVKMGYMLALWFAPPSCISPASRGLTFSWLDSLGKWSMIDIFITVLSLVAFRISASSPDFLPDHHGNATAAAYFAALLPDDFFVLDLYVTVQWGLYSNLIAQVLSQFVSHAAIWSHHNALAAAAVAKAAAARRAHDKATGGAKAPISPTVKGNDGDKAAARFARLAAGGWQEVHDPTDGSTYFHNASTGESVWQLPASVAASLPPSSPGQRPPSLLPRRSRSELSPLGVAMAMSAVSGEADGDEMGDAADEGAAAAERIDAATAPQSLPRVCDTPLYDGASGRMRRPRAVPRAALLAMALLGALLVVIGASVPSFYTGIYGLAGIFLEVGTAEARRGTEFSVWGVVGLIAAQGADGAGGGPGGGGSLLGMLFLALIFVLCTLLVPVAQCLLLARLWTRRLTCRELRGLLAANEVLAAWQYLEVYLIGIILLLLQIGQVSRFMLDGACDPLQPAFDALVRMGLLEQRDAECFYIFADVEAGCYLLIIAAVCLNVCNQVVCRRARACVRARQGAAMGKPVGARESVASPSMRRAPAPFGATLSSCLDGFLWMYLPVGAGSSSPVQVRAAGVHGGASVVARGGAQELVGPWRDPDPPAGRTRTSSWMEKVHGVVANSPIGSRISNRVKATDEEVTPALAEASCELSSTGGCAVGARGMGPANVQRHTSVSAHI